MTRRSFTSLLYRSARVSNNRRAASHGPGACAKRVVRRKVYSKQMGLTRSILKAFGPSEQGCVFIIGRTQRRVPEPSCATASRRRHIEDQLHPGCTYAWIDCNTGAALTTC